VMSIWKRNSPSGSASTISRDRTTPMEVRRLTRRSENGYSQRRGVSLVRSSYSHEAEATFEVQSHDSSRNV
jgi:hypothetical protein